MSKRRLLTLLLSVVLTLTVVLVPDGSVFALEYDSRIPTPEILDCQGIGYNMVAFGVSMSSSYDCEIYRATSENGTYKHVDTLVQSGLSWMSLDNGYWQASCKKKKITCLRNDDATEYIFYDSTLTFGKTYYYKVRLVRNESHGDFSQVVSGAPVLGGADVTIIKGFANPSVKPKLYWNGIKGCQGYKIYRKTSGAEWKRVKTVKGAKNLIWTDTSARKGKMYSYRIRAYRVSGGKTYYSDYSNVFRVSTKTPKIKGKYNKGSVYGPYLSTKELQDVKRAVQGFKLNYIKSDMSDYEKIEAAYLFMQNTCTYAYAGWQYNQANTAWGALVYGEAQCSGYARGMKALCDAIGIPCYYVHANSKSLNPSHQWNQVKIDGKWYILDAQGGYFLVSGKTYRYTGMRWNTKGLPTCKSDYFK